MNNEDKPDMSALVFMTKVSVVASIAVMIGVAIIFCRLARLEASVSFIEQDLGIKREIRHLPESNGTDLSNDVGQR